MEEQKKVKVTNKESRNIIIRKLRNRKIICSLNENCGGDIVSDNFGLEILSCERGNYYSGEEREYVKVNIQISTNESPHTLRRLNDFDVLKGDYKLLTEKVKFIIQDDLRIKKEQTLKEILEHNNLELLGQKLRGTGSRHSEGDSYYIKKTKYGEFTFYAHEDRISVDFEENRDMTLEQGIEMLNKLK